jgi:hypothetical protein
VSDDVKILITLDNRGEQKTINLKTVNTAEFFAITLAYVQFLEELAEGLNIPLTFRGAELREGSAAAALTPSDRMAAQLVENTGLRLLTGQEEPSKDLEPVVKKFQRTLHLVPPDHVVSVVTTTNRTVHLEALQQVSVRRAVERTSFYGQLITVGGKGKPVARFFAEREGPYLIPLHLQSRDKASVLGAHLYQTLFVDAEIERAPGTGDILGGTLLSFQELESNKNESVSKWREWFASTVSKLPDLDEMMRSRHSEDPEVE